MPSIKITEVDATSGGTVLSAQDVVFVPGFINKKYITEVTTTETDDEGNETTTVTYSTKDGMAEAYQPILCTDISEFESYFGSVPAAFAETQKYPGGFDTVAYTGKTDAASITDNDKIMFAAGTMDPGYVFAKELLNIGVPVLYVRLNEAHSDISVEHMYDTLSGNTEFQLWDELEDIGEYSEVKYLTSGGYPTFEYSNLGYPQPTYSGISVGPEEFSAKTFTAKTGSIENTTTYKFIYAELVAAETTKHYTTKEALEAAVADGELVADDYAFAEDEKKLYKVNSTKVIEEVDFDEWSLYINDARVETGVDMSTYGFIFSEYTVPEYGATITIIRSVAKSSTIVNKMITCAASRGDCVALIDHTNRADRPLDPTSKKSVYFAITNVDSPYRVSTNGEFATMFTPWCGYNFASALTDSTSNDTAPTAMPASFGYLLALGESIQTNVNWLAIAGAARGPVNITKPMLTGNLRLSNAIANKYQPRDGIAINAITNIKPYGYIIWGNRTLKNNATEGNLTATSFLNTRNMVSDIKKEAYKAAKRCMFEQNSDILWLNYKARVTPLLDKMVTGNGLSGYKLIRGTTTEKAKLVCTIRLYPIYAVEAFDITVELADEEVTIS